jgi:predicted RecB family nuclease
MITTINNKNYHIDIPGNRITFLDSRWYYSENGVPVPSVTTILDAYPKGPEYFAWLKKMGEDSDTIRDEAGKRGSKVHDMTEKYDNGIEVSLIGETDEVSVSLMEWAMFSRYVEFSNRFPHENAAIEMHVISEALGYAGTLDRIIVLNGKRLLIDIKTSNAVYDSYWLQLAAYKNLLRKMGTEVDGAAILWLNAKTRTEGKKDAIQGTGWQLISRSEEDQVKDKKLFKHTHALWLSQNEGLTPKQVSYQLTHKK